MDFLICSFGDPDNHLLVPFIEEQRLGIELQSYGLRGVKSKEAWETTLANHRAIASKLSTRIAVHGPFIGIRYWGYDCLLKDATQKRMDMTFDVVKELKADTLVLHTSYSRDVEAFQLEETWFRTARDYWQKEIERYSAIGVQVVLENLLERTPDAMAQLATAVDNDHFGLCLDVGHVNVFSEVSPSVWVEVLGDHLKHIHLHDNHGQRDEHLPVGEGTIDFDAFFRTLEQVVPNVTISLEVDAEPEVKQQNMVDVLKQYGPESKG